MCNKPNRVSTLIAGFKARYILKPYTEVYEGVGYAETFKAEWTGLPVTMEEIRKSVDDCPNCIFSIIRQCKFAYHYFGEDSDFKKFDYKTEFNNAMAEKNHMNECENYY